MIFYRRQKQINELNISINGTDIQRVESFNFIGLYTFMKACLGEYILYRPNNIFP